MNDRDLFDVVWIAVESHPKTRHFDTLDICFVDVSFFCECDCFSFLSFNSFQHKYNHTKELVSEQRSIWVPTIQEGLELTFYNCIYNNNSKSTTNRTNTFRKKERKRDTIWFEVNNKMRIPITAIITHLIKRLERPLSRSSFPNAEKPQKKHTLRVN